VSEPSSEPALSHRPESRPGACRVVKLEAAAAPTRTIRGRDQQRRQHFFGEVNQIGRSGGLHLNIM
jgi:hypothetical protein